MKKCFRRVASVLGMMAALAAGVGAQAAHAATTENHATVTPTVIDSDRTLKHDVVPVQR